MSKPVLPVPPESPFAAVNPLHGFSSGSVSTVPWCEGCGQRAPQYAVIFPFAPSSQRLLCLYCMLDIWHRYAKPVPSGEAIKLLEAPKEERTA